MKTNVTRKVNNYFSTLHSKGRVRGYRGIGERNKERK